MVIKSTTFSIDANNNESNYMDFFINQDSCNLFN